MNVSDSFDTTLLRPQPKLGIIAGGGDVARSVIRACQSQNRPFVVLAYAGQTDPETYVSVPHIMVPLGHVGEAIARLKEEHVQELVLIGKFRRPSWSELKPDGMAARWLMQSARTMFGDDALLKTIVRNLEKEGFRIVAAEEILGSHVLMPQGTLGDYSPDACAEQDIQRGFFVAKRLGACDVGQSVVVQQGLVLGVEAIEGTDQLLLRCTHLRRPGLGGVLVKTLKPNQEKRADRPVAGPQTVYHAAEAGLRGIALEAGEILLYDLPQMIQIANQRSLFLVGVQREDHQEVLL